jgi:hypothetical protein
MKVCVVWLVAAGIAGSVLCPGCASYHDPVTGEEATYGCETLRAKIELEIGAVYAATRRAAADLHLRVTRAAQDGISGEIRATDAQRDMVEICLGALPGNRTALSIRVGPFGDKHKSIVVFERIMENLSRARQLAAVPTVQWGGWPIEPRTKPSAAPAALATEAP